MQARLDNDREAEIAEALLQIGLISKLRIQDAVTQ
jgi:2-oxo-4-hydroxy-4-carboxy-5-ureidoimidazoline decarboxylase